MNVTIFSKSGKVVDFQDVELESEIKTNGVIEVSVVHGEDVVAIFYDPDAILNSDSEEDIEANEGSLSREEANKILQEIAEREAA